MDFSNLKILHIDDDPQLIRAVDRQLGQLGFSNRFATTDPLQASELLAELQPQIVILDVGLPQIDGVDLLAQIKAQDASILVVMLTATRSQDVVERCRRAGAETVVFKPLSDHDVKFALDACRRKLNGWTLAFQACQA